MLGKYLRLVQALSISKLGRFGVVLVTSSFVTMIILEMARFGGILTNAYIGLVTYMLLPALFVVGLILIPIGWRRYKKSTGKTARQLLSERLDDPDTEQGFFGSRVFQSIAVLTLVNVVFLSVISSRMLHFMDGSHFCGTACHSVMDPEWITYQASPHARVQCVECHVGEGVGAFLDSKLNGVWQMVSVTFDLLERPIPTPVHNLRPSRETCEHCHWPEKFYGSRLKTITRHRKDEGSTPLYTTLGIKVDVGKGGPRSGIHWHIGAENKVRYASVDDERKEMIWVDVRQPEGSFKRYQNLNLPPQADASQVRALDCVDCHNRATHIYEDPSDLVDDRIDHDLIDSSLPFIKREALAALTAKYPSEDHAMKGMANHLRGYYKRQHLEIYENKLPEIDAAVEVLREAYRRNVHHDMKIKWRTYPSLIGHDGEGGCFRCHNLDIVDDQGSAISSDCTLCHSILAYDSPEPFAFIQRPDPSDAEYRMHEYLREEFLDSSNR